ncbi:capsid protein [robinz virus RP_99]|nr:capsid protein [robinz virus RP_99]
MARRRRSVARKRSRSAATTRKGYRTRRTTSRLVKRRSRTRRMTTKKILNLASTKKKDVMIGGTTFPPTASDVGALTVTSDAPAVLLWNASARNLSLTPTSAFEIPGKPQRTASDTYFVGVSDKITIRTDTSNAWRWRRIVFSHKGLIPGFTDTSDVLRTFYELPTGTGLNAMQRVATALPFALVADLYSFVFRGLGINNISATPADWIDPITAPIDTSRISVMYDKTRNIRSGNDAGVVSTHRLYHPVKRTIHYGDHEIAGSMTSSPLSTTAKPGIGDIYVMDIIIGNSGDAGDSLDWLPTSTVYWHEK